MAEARRRGRPAGAAILALAVLAAFATSFAGGFQFDDWNVIVDEPRVQSLAAWWRSMPGIRPLLKLTFAANQASGLGLAGFHAVNLGVHLGAALLALALLRRLEAGFTHGDEVPAPGAAAALLGALLFALHPVQTEAVTYLSGRSSALAGLLALGSALAWVEGRRTGRPGLVHGLSPLLMLLSLGVKESAVALPLALLVLARAGPAAGWRAALRDTAVHWAVLLVVAAAAAASPAYRAMAVHSAALRAPLENLAAHLGGLWWLAGQAVRPWALLADPSLPAPAGFPWTAGLAGLGLLALLVSGLARRGPAGAGGALVPGLAAGLGLDPAAPRAGQRSAALPGAARPRLAGRSLAGGRADRDRPAARRGRRRGGHPDRRPGAPHGEAQPGLPGRGGLLGRRGVEVSGQLEGLQQPRPGALGGLPARRGGHRLRDGGGARPR